MITLAQVGVGLWGQNHLRILSSLKDCRMKTCCDKNKDTLDKIGVTYNQKIKLTDDIKDVLGDTEIEGVVIVTPAVTHAELAIRALESGKHVFVEKPLTLDLEDGKKMVEVAHKNKRILMVGHLLLYHPAVLKLREYIHSGELGEILYIYSTRVNLGQVREEENVLWSLTSHDISVALFLLDDMPVEVTVMGQSYLRKGIEDVVFANIKFRNNVLVHIHAGWLDPHKMRKFTIVGSKKMAIFDDMESNEKIRLYDKGVDWHKRIGTYDAFLTLREGDIHIPKLDMVEPLKLECRHFLDCIAQKKEPLTNGESGLDVLKVLTAAQQSMEKNGISIKIDEEKQG